MTGGLLQVRYTTRGFDLPLDRLGVIPGADERKIKQALARYLAVPGDWLNRYVVQRNGENVMLRELVED